MIGIDRNISIGDQITLPICESKDTGPAMLCSGKHTEHHFFSPCFMGNSTISMATFHSYLKLPEGNFGTPLEIDRVGRGSPM